MCICNQKRAMYSPGSSQPQKGMVKVQLLDNNPVVINGDITGRMYVFRHINDFNWVDKRDAISLQEISGLQVIY